MKGRINYSSLNARKQCMVVSKRDNSNYELHIGNVKTSRSGNQIIWGLLQQEKENVESKWMRIGINSFQKRHYVVKQNILLNK